MVEVSVLQHEGRISVLVTSLPDLHAYWSMSPDEARELVNHIGGAIKAATTAEAKA